MSGLGLVSLPCYATACRAIRPALPPDSLPVRPWYLPHHMIGQVAGGQGMITLGAGYRIIPHRLELDLLAGYVPRRYSITAMGIFTAKASYLPWVVPLGSQGWVVNPLAMGAQVNYTASRGLNTSRDDKYYKDYYWWSSHTRLGVFVGGRVAYSLPLRAPTRPRRYASLYYELGTNDLYLISWWDNRGALSVGDLLTLGLGLKLDL
jgi:hypothetical protein